MTDPHTLPLSVVIPTHNRREFLHRLLDGLCRQSIPAEGFEVIVAVDGSSDGTSEMLDSYRAPYRLIVHQQARLGQAAARNAAIRLACGRLLVMLDDDMEPSPNLLAAHMAGHTGESRTALVGAAPVVLDARPSPVVRYVADKFNGNLARLTDAAANPVTHRDFYSGNFSCPRELLLAVGAFDEDFRVYGHEDGDLALRLQAAGGRLGYSRDALAYQHYTKDFAGLAHDNLHKGQTAVLLARKHPQAVADLKLSRYGDASVRWRALRLAMLRLSEVFTWVPEVVIAVTAALERLVPNRLQRYYFFALDYFYWLGARAGGHLLQR